MPVRTWRRVRGREDRARNGLRANRFRRLELKISKFYQNTVLYRRSKYRRIKKNYILENGDAYSRSYRRRLPIVFGGSEGSRSTNDRPHAVVAVMSAE